MLPSILWGFLEERFKGAEEQRDKGKNFATSLPIAIGIARLKPDKENKKLCVLAP